MDESDRDRLASVLPGSLQGRWRRPRRWSVRRRAVCSGVTPLATAAHETNSTAAACNQHESADHPHVHGAGCGHETVEHGDHVDYVHDGHRHADHEDHYDEHGDTD